MDTRPVRVRRPAARVLLTAVMAATVVTVATVAWSIAIGALDPPRAGAQQVDPVPRVSTAAQDGSGTTDYDTQVLNGANYQNPGWVTAVLHGGAYACSASLIDPEWVLTAAHCVDSSSITVRVGQNSRNDTSRSRSVDLVLVHPGYSPFNIYSTDIALLRLSQPVTDVPWARVAGNTGQPTAGQALTIAGWGQTFTDSPAPVNLQGGSVLATSGANGSVQAGCDRTAVSPSGYDDFCFQGRNGSGAVGSCPGDSGGPLFGTLPGGGAQDVIYGVVSFGPAAGCSLWLADDVAQGVPRQALWIFDQLAVHSRLGAYEAPVVVGTGTLPVGYLDGITAQAGSVRVSGWAFDRDTTRPLDVRVTVDGSTAATVTAAGVRPDVLAAFANGSYRGFDATVPVGRGTRRVCVEMIGAPSRNLVSLGCRTLSVTQSAPPVGFLDAAVGQAGQITVAGWAGDVDTSGSVPVHVYVDGAFAGGALASGPRFDVAQAFPGLGSATGFDFAVPATAGNHTVCVYGLNDGPSALLGCRTTNVTAGSVPKGFLDAAVRSGSSIRVVGWAGDASTTAATPVHVYVDGAFAGGRLADRPRGDVAAAFPQLGATTGFDFTVAAAAGPRQVCVIALDDAGFHTTLSCRTVS